MKLLRLYWLLFALLAPVSLAVAADSFINYADPSGVWQRFKAVDNGDGTFSFSVSGSSTSVGTNGATAPTSSTEQGCVAQSAESVVAAGQLGGVACDLAKKQIVLPYSNPENFVSGTITSAMTGTTSTSLVGAPGAGLRNYITQITCSNSHATVGTDILVQDGNGGATLYVIPAAPAFGGAVVPFPTPLRQPTTNTALFVANVTTGSNTKCSASGYKGS